MITAATQMFFTSVLDAKLATFQATDLSNTGEEGAGIGGGGGAVATPAQEQALGGVHEAN